MDKYYNYDPPFNQLLTIGDIGDSKEEINYIEQFGLQAEHIPDLLRMMNDEELNHEDSDTDEVWAPLHAWRALGQLDVATALDAMLKRLLIRQLDDDWLHEDTRELIGRSGKSQISKIAQFIADHSTEDYPAITVISGLGKLGQNHADMRDECVAILTKQLKKSAGNTESVNGFLVAELLDLKAIESIGVIESAYYLGHVDPTICGKLEDVYVDFGMQEERPVSKEEENLGIAARIHALQNAKPEDIPKLFPMFARKKPKTRKKFGKKHHKRNN